MAELVTMPKLGFDMAEGTLVRWVKAEGDPVSKGEVIAEIETDKATVEVESGFSGVMFRHLADEGEDLPVNTAIAVIADKGETPSDEQVESLISAAGGKPRKTAVKSPGKVEVIEKSAAEDAKKKAPVTAEAPGAEPAGGVRSSPLARRIAKDKDVDLDDVQGSGPRGRVVKKDIEKYLETLRAEGRTEEVAAVEKTHRPIAFTAGEIHEDKVISMSRLRQAIARRMQESNQNFPHFYLTREFKTGALMQLRKEINLLLSDAEKVSVNDFIIKAVALALRHYPNLNASIEDETHIRRFGQINIGVAVAVEGGLMTVVVENADQKPVRMIGREVRDMASRAREGKVRNEDIIGSTFSISNLGMYGIDEFAAIINPPEAAILAVSAVQDKPVVEDGELKAGSRMKATLSADHRVTDGAESAEFMQVLAEYLEEPMRLLL